MKIWKKIYDSETQIYNEIKDTEKVVHIISTRKVTKKGFEDGGYIVVELEK